MKTLKRMERRTKNILGFSIFIILIAGWIALFKYINPQLIVAKVGATNGYIILFLIGTLGGASTFTGPSYFIALTTLAAGGLNPVILGICGGLGITIGDTIVFFILVSAAKKAPDKFKEKFEKFEKLIYRKPKWMINLIFYLYVGLTPLPNEIAAVSLGIIGHEKKSVILFLFLGNITSGILGALLVKYGISLFGI